MIDDATLLLLWGNTQGYVKEIERQHCQLYNTAALYPPFTHAEILVGCANVFFYFYINSSASYQMIMTRIKMVTMIQMTIKLMLKVEEDSQVYQ